jgi:putative membrane protein
MRKTKLGVAVAVLATAAAVVASGFARPAAVAPLDEHWLDASAQGDMYEVAVGNVLQQKGASYSCTVARMLVADHSKALADTKKLARQLGVKLPARPNPLQRQLITELARASGFNLQRMFAAFGGADHQLDIAEAKEAAKKASNPRVKAAARKELPVLKKHLGAFTDLLRTTLAQSAGGGAATQPTTTTASGAAATTTSTTTTPATTTPAAGCA